MKRSRAHVVATWAFAILGVYLIVGLVVALVVTAGGGS